ncbi:MAG TPA: acyltransferase [Bacillota bacterium]|nr:acyltransferase [Bacillota bacterium]
MVASEHGPRRLNTFPVRGSNSLGQWRRIVPWWRPAKNFLLIYLARFSPSLRFKRLLYRLTGMRVGRGSSIGLMAMFDVFFPELIELGENSIVGYAATILAHEFLIDECRTGKVTIGRDVVIGANVTILPGVSVGDRTIVSAGSMVNRDLPAGVLAGGVPARIIRRLNEAKPPNPEWAE